MKDKNTNVIMEEIICFWRDIVLLLIPVSILMVIFFPSAGELMLALFMGSIGMVILITISDGIISRIKKRKSLDKYSGLDSD